MKRRWAIVFGVICAGIAIAILFLLPSVQRHTQSVNCGNQMHSVLFAATLLWPNDHEGKLPSDFLSMSNELGTPKILVCPSDKLHQAAVNWASFGTSNSSYEIVSPGLPKSSSNIVFMRCNIHGYVGYADDRLLDSSGNLVRKKIF